MIFVTFHNENELPVYSNIYFSFVLYSTRFYLSISMNLLYNMFKFVTFINVR